MSRDKLKYRVKQQFLSRDINFMSRWRLCYTMTGKQACAAIN